MYQLLETRHFSTDHLFADSLFGNLAIVIRSLLG